MHGPIFRQFGQLHKPLSASVFSTAGKVDETPQSMFCVVFSCASIARLRFRNPGVNMADWPAPVSLKGNYVSVVPLSHAHHDDLVEATADGELHKLWYTMIPDGAGMAAEIDRRLSLSNMLPFAIIDNASGKAVGMTTYMNIEQAHKRLEIGSTWYRKSVQRTPLNTECKLLLLQHAFEDLDCICVEFRTHFANVQSRRAIERLGAKFDGVLRSHMIMANGSVRDTAAYSIIASECSTVKANLTWKLENFRSD